MSSKCEQDGRDLPLLEAAKYLGVSKTFLFDECKARRITYIKIGNRIRISLLDLDLYRAEHTVEKAASE
jgi:excisionase family DNA binding protein